MKQLNVEEIEKWNATEEVELFLKGKLIGKLIPNEAITTVPIKDIVNQRTNFFIPAYQRGYRWDKKQVVDLLEDIWEHGENQSSSETTIKNRYCLQPIVLKKSENKNYDYDLVDGQQRLTTLFIILNTLGKTPNFTLNYETREESAEFLKNIEKETDTSNIDYFHFKQTFDLTKNFFKTHDKEQWLNYLKNDVFGAFFIVYNATQAGDERASEAIFTGLNAGKIPLTDSELVKGLFLRKSNFDELSVQNEIIEISTEWDRIEQRLREKNFWAWLGQEETDEPRIDFVLSIVAENQKFHKYFLDKLAESRENIKNVWIEIKKCFMTLEDWYDNLEIYHLIGFLNKNSEDIAGYYNKYLHDTLDFRKETGAEGLLKNLKDGNLSYDENPGLVRKVLFLFNILTCIETKSRFRFDSYQEKKYDIEHIAPHSETDKLTKVKDREDWLYKVESSGLFPERNFDIDVSEESAFQNLYAELADNQRLGSEDINGIGNLCLLDETTNRGYGNKPFPLKVQIIMEIDADQKNSEYILPATKNVFLKYYSGLNINNLTWEEKDAKNYQSAIQKMLERFIGGV